MPVDDSIEGVVPKVIRASTCGLFPFKSSACCVADDIGFNKSVVLSTLLNRPLIV